MKEEIQEAAKNYGWRIKRNTFSDAVKANELAESAQQDFIAGAKYQSKRMYSEEEVLEIVQTFNDVCERPNKPHQIKNWFEQFKKKQNEI